MAGSRRFPAVSFPGRAAARFGEYPSGECGFTSSRYRPAAQTGSPMPEKIFDISVPVFTGMVVYPGDAGAEVNPVREISRGDAANLSELRLGSHTGTHVDAPRHFVEAGATIDMMPMHLLVGRARVLDLTAVEAEVGPADLTAAGIGGAGRILLKTTNSALWSQAEFSKEFVSLSPAAADFLVERGTLLVGIDYLSIERFHPPVHRVHEALLKASVAVLEGVDLSGVPAGDYRLACLPLKIRGGDGAPARAVLIAE